MEELRYPVGVQSFREIVEGGYVYVDKTWCIPLLRRNKFYFLGRPRRFGKSLLLSMLREYFEGNRELFRGLAIDRLEPGEWTRHPVFHIDLNGENYTVRGSVYNRLSDQLTVYEKVYGLAGSDKTLSSRFMELVETAVGTTGQKAVILIDEYDKPLTDNILDEEMYGIHQADLRGFYSSLKTLDPYIEFALLTGVTKFGKLNVFSGLNNLYDISLNDEYAAICGITEEELHLYLDSGVRLLAEKQHVDVESMYGELKQRYDGYHFSVNSPDIYNPFSLLITLSRKVTGDYWFSTGTAKMLVDLVIRNHIPVYDLEGTESTETELSDITMFGSNPVPLLYQTGYLTLKSYDPKYRSFVLGYPNEEVRNGFLTEFLTDYAGKGTNVGFSARKMSELLDAGEAKKFLEMLKAFFASMPYDLRKYQGYESFWQTVMYVLLTMLGYYTEAERHMSEGSIDLTVRTPGYVYVMELKVADRPKPDDFVEGEDGIFMVCEPEATYGKPSDDDDSWDEPAEVRRQLDAAVRQIEERCYAAPFAAEGRKVIRIAAVFSARRHNLVMARIF